MPKVCFVYGQKYVKGGSSSFHQVPKDIQIRKKWLRKMHTDTQDASNLSVYTFLCSSHFKKTDFYFTPSGKRCLKKGVVPQIELPAMTDIEPGTSQRVNIVFDNSNRDFGMPEENSASFFDNSDKENMQPLSPSLQTVTSSSTETAPLESTSEEEPSPKRKKSLISTFEIHKKKHFSLSTDNGDESSATETAPEARQFLKMYDEKKHLSSSDIASELLEGIESSATETAPETEQFLVRKTEPKSFLSVRNKKRLNQVRYFGDISFEDLRNPARAKKSWLIIKSTISSQRNALLKYFREQRLITTENAETAIEASLHGAAGDLFKRCLKGPSRQKYDPLLRSFALTLNFYSPKAYNFVREKFNNSLPHPSTMTKWYQSVDGTPGFTSEAVIALNAKVSEARKRGGNIICNLVMDEIAIRKRIEWTGTKTTGYVDIGSGINSDSVPVAKEALVYMLVAVNGHWKIPVGYFLIDGLSASERANLVFRLHSSNRSDY